MNSTSTVDGIAIIGMAGRFPGAASVAQFWENLCAGRESVATFSDEQLRASGIAPEEFSDPNYVRRRAVLERPEWFDAAFFGMTPREAELTDPQQRLFLECCWEAFEDAARDPNRGTRNVGVFASASFNTYALRQVLGGARAIAEFTKVFQADAYNILVGADKDYLATRVAYKLDLRGPALTIQTACSSSLVAVAQAFASLQSFQCDLALAGGVSVSFPQERGHQFQDGAIPSADGHCRAFDAAASGTVFGAGCAVVLLKRLEDALNDGDRIHAVIRSVAVNNDGAGKMSYSAPSQDGQAEVIALAQALAGVSADDISYVEAHGTGTPVGDPIEVAALTQAFRGSTKRTGFCGLGSLKTNVGHLEAAAGVTGLIKTALALHHRHIPGSLHFTAPNPAIAFAESPFHVVDRGRDWEGVPLPRRAGVSSFGVGGTNAHAILEEAPVRVPVQSRETTELFVLSARSENALNTMATNLAVTLTRSAGTNGDVAPPRLQDVAYTLRQGRAEMEVRRAVIARSHEELRSALVSPKAPFVSSATVKRGIAPEVVFLFPGQGAQYVGMARELYANEPVFREHVDACLDEVPQLTELRPLLLSSSQSPAGEESQRLLQTSITQPALFIVEYALARLWMSWGIRPGACIGHSLGEYVAAVLAGVFSLRDALMLLTSRASLMQSMPPGGMLSVRLRDEELIPRLSGSLALAVVNAPQLCVISGERAEVDELRASLEAENVGCRVLHTSHAFHSPMMDPVVTQFAEIVRQVPLQPPHLPIVSTVTAQFIRPEEWTDPMYWARQLRVPVRFGDALTTVFQRGNQILLEVGPGQTLASLARQRKDRPAHTIGLASFPPIGEGGEHAAVLGATGALWTRGVAIDWAAFDAARTGDRIELPTYPFERQRCWCEPDTSAGLNAAGKHRDDSLTEQTILAQLEIMRTQLQTLAGSR